MPPVAVHFIELSVKAANFLCEDVQWVSAHQCWAVQNCSTLERRNASNMGLQAIEQIYHRKSHR